MKNKNVGFLIVGISVVIGIIVLIFNLGLKKIVKGSCGMEACPMYDTIATQTFLSLAIAAIVLVIGLFLIFSKEEEKIIVKKIKVGTEKRKPVDYSKLTGEEKKLIKLIEEAQGTIFQSELVEKSEFSKAKVSRILDRLEGRQIIERKRRGMTNVVVLKV
jgi:uncharacterized membrane protein